MLITADVLARVLRLLAAVAGGCLAWLLYDWLGDPWDFCDYPSMSRQLVWPNLILVQCVWVLGVAAAGLSAFAAWRARWPRRDIALIVVGFAGLVASLATTPMHWGGRQMTAAQVEGNWYVWSSHGDGYERLGMLAAVTSLILGWRAASGHPRAKT